MRSSNLAEDWRRSVVSYLSRHPDHPLKPRALARELRIPNADYTSFRVRLRDLLAAGTLVLGPGRTLRLPGEKGLIVGTFRANPRGFGFVERPPHPDLYVAPRSADGALDGDTVQARVVHSTRRGSGLQAEVVRVVERAPLTRVGLLEHSGRTWVVRARGRDALPPVRISNPTAGAARPGDLVVIELLEHTIGTPDVRGAIVERLGDPGDARTQILGVIRRLAVRDEFPVAVRQAARHAAAQFDPDAPAAREDLRDLLTITIDPPDARDFDDAISVEPASEGRVRLGVHIADVSHFVPQDGAVDLEARRRGTSVYFPGCVVPMLPEVLANGVCSLQPGEPRLTRSVFITYDRAAQVVSTRFAITLICSGARLTYPGVTAVLEGKPADVTPDVESLLHRAGDLARRIQRRRLHDGMISLTLPEVQIRLDDRGRVLDAGPADTGFSHTLIEMFMVEANEAVSRHLTHAGLAHLRRVHPEPDPEAAEALAQLAPLLGDRVPRSLDRHSILRVLAAVRGRPEEGAVNYVLLRALPQALYSPSDEGHFALASDDYCHFTSPIRRYPDLTVHRLLDVAAKAGSGRRGRSKSAAVLTSAELAELGRQTSAAERRAQQAEREARQCLLLTLMRSKVGSVFDAVITGLVSIGAFVQVMPYMAEGLVRVAHFGADTWEFDGRRGVFHGRRTRRLVTFGQPLRVRVAGVDELRQELALVPSEGGPIGVAVGGAIHYTSSGGSRQRKERARRR